MGVCFNKVVRRIFGYYDFESVMHLLFSFHVLPIDLFITRAALLLFGSVLRSNRDVLIVCTRWQHDREKCVGVRSRL